MENGIQMLRRAFRVSSAPPRTYQCTCNVPTFQNDILREYLDLIAVGILDDVIIFSESLPEHIPHVRNILKVLRQHKLYAKVEKCEFHKDQMTFVGYLVSKEGIGMDPT